MSLDTNTIWQFVIDCGKSRRDLYNDDLFEITTACMLKFEVVSIKEGLLC